MAVFSQYTGTQFHPWPADADSLYQKNAPTYSDGWPLGDKAFAEQAVQHRRRDYSEWLSSHLAVLGAPRACADVWVLVLLATTLSLALILCASPLFVGDPRWLQSEVDYHARLCGGTPLLRDRPFVYWPQPRHLASRVCVGSCPTSEDVVNSRTVRLPTAQGLMVTGSDAGQRSEWSQTLWMEEVPVYPTSPAFGRFCMPPPQALLVSYSGDGDNLPSLSGSPEQWRASSVFLGPLALAQGGVAPQLRRLFGDLRQARSLPAVSALVIFSAFCLGGVSVVLLRRCPLCFTCVAVGGVIIVSVGLGLLLLVFSRRLSSDPSVVVLAGLQPCVARALGIVLIAVGMVIGLCSWFLRHALFRASGFVYVVLTLLCSDRSLARLWCVPCLVAIPQLAGIWAAFRLLPWCVSIAVVRWPQEPVFSPEGSNVTAPVGSVVVFGLYRSLEFQSTISIVCTLAVLLSARLWILLVDIWARYAIAVAVSGWYYAKPDRTTGKRQPLHAEGFWMAPLIAGRYHAGTLTAHGFCRLVLPEVLILVVACAAAACLEPWSHREDLILDDSPRASELHVDGARFTQKDQQGRHRCAFAVQELVAVFCPGALVSVATSGESLQSSRESVVSAAPCALPAVQCLQGWAGVLGSFVTLLVAMPLCLLSPAAVSGNEIAYLGVAAFVVLLGHTAASSWALLYGTVADVLLFCLALDDAGHRSFGYGQEDSSAEGEVGIQLDPSPGVAVQTSYALWSSSYTPQLLRNFMFSVSDELRAMPDQDDQEDSASCAGSNAASGSAAHLLGPEADENGLVGEEVPAL